MPPVQKISGFAGPAGVGGHWRQSAIVKVYGINRYLDPGDGRVMHERHAVYRLEQQPSWITRSPRNQDEVILGPMVGLRRPEYAPEPEPGETSREIFQARRGIEEANEGMKDLRESQEKLTSGLEAMAKNTAEAERKLTSVVSVLNERVKHLEGDSPAVDPSQVKAIESGEGDVVVRSPSP
ncbi:MAG: hypothetical protein QOE88_2089 [Verrucomicrobiota bacterium]|nr:hypothetical protein [Verrucomicrobiota bacterium]